MRPYQIGINSPSFNLKSLQRDINCVAIQDPSQVWGMLDFMSRRNLLLATDTLATQNVTVVATTYKLYMQGTGSITLSGTGSGTLNGTGANDRVVLSFTPTVGTLTLTVSGSVTYGMLCRADTIDQSYQRISDWVTEQYAWAAQKSVPWLRRNMLLNVSAWTGAVAGTPGTVPTGWGFIASNGTTGVSTKYLTMSTASSTRHLIAFTPSAGIVGQKYTIMARVTVNSGTLPVTAGTNEIIRIVNATEDGAYIDGVLTTGNAPVGTEFLLEKVCTATATAISVRIGVGTSGNNYGASITVSDVQLVAGDAVGCPYQPIGASWDATYTTNAIAAGYQISLWQDSAGTTAVNGDNQTVGKCVNIKSPGTYDATQATAANQPKWRLDANGKPYIERDLVNDSLPITLPNLGSNCSIYIGEGSTVTESTGQTLNGSYAPITPAKDYGRVIFQSPTSNAAKVIKWLKAKAGY